MSQSRVHTFGQKKSKSFKTMLLIRDLLRHATSCREAVWSRPAEQLASAERRAN